MNNVNQIEEQVEDFNVEALEEKLEMLVLWSW